MSRAIEGVRRETYNNLYDFTGANDGSYAVSFEKFTKGSKIDTE